MGQISRSNREQQRIRELEAELHSLHKQRNEKDEVIDILKMRRHLVETIVEKYHCVQTLACHRITVEQACRILEISRRGYYDWLKRKPGIRKKRNQALKWKLMELHGRHPTSRA